MKARYAICRNGDKISVKRADRNHDFGEVIANCETLKEAFMRAREARAELKLNISNAEAHWRRSRTVERRCSACCAVPELYHSRHDAMKWIECDCKGGRVCEEYDTFPDADVWAKWDKQNGSIHRQPTGGTVQNVVGNFCPNCNGTGQEVVDHVQYGPQVNECPDCDGTGLIANMKADG